MLVYISCADQDVDQGKHLQSICSPVAKQFGFTAWSRKSILPGQRWQKEMASHLGLAFLFVPLLSADWLSSDICQAELTAALRLYETQTLKIVPILLRPSGWEYSALSVFPVLPSNKKDITLWSNKASAWKNVLDDLIKIISSYQVR